MKSRKVSVNLPVKNGGAYLKQAIESILSQTYQNVEIILVDDHSTDGAPERVAKLDDRIRLIKNEGSGVAGAANTAINNSNGQYIARMDADDISMPTRLEKQIAYLDEHSDIDVVGSGVEIFSDDVLGEGYQRYEEWVNSINTPDEIARTIFTESPIPNPTAMFRREVFEDVGGYEQNGWPEDYQFWLRAWAAGAVMAKIDEPLLRWRDWSGRATRNDDRYSFSSFMAVKAHYLARTVLKDKKAVIWGAGPNGRTLGKMLIDEGASVDAFIDINRRKVGGSKIGRPIYGPEHAAKIDDEIILGCVGSRGARDEIRNSLVAAGHVEGSTFWMVL